MITWKMIKGLTEDPSKEFVRELDGLHIKVNKDSELIWDNGYQFIRLGHTWKEVRKPVDFMTAVQSEKPISVEFSGVKIEKETLANMLHKLQHYGDKTIERIIMYGDWYIEDKETHKMSKYRKKPVVVEALQYDGTDDSFYELMRFSSGDVSWHKESAMPLIETLEGNLSVSVGDYVIKGVNGEFYPCKPDVFDKTYDAVTDEGQTESD